MNRRTLSLLTGAGFTYNFGAPLAQTMWSWIFNQPRIQSSRKLVRLLQNNLDYEGAYYSVMTGGYTDAEKDAMRLAMSEAYEKVDEIVRSPEIGECTIHGVNIERVQKLIAGFAGSTGNPGYFFTLNQDLFIERNYYNGPKLHVPGVPPDRRWFDVNYFVPLSARDFRRIPGQEELEDIKRNPPVSPFYYIKLHGSYNWRSDEQSEYMVIGRNKDEMIDREPLLAWYLSVFKEVVSSDNAHLMIIGYSFSDAHINGIIASAVRKRGLKLHIISPQSPKSLRDSLKEKPQIDGLWEGLSGYYPYKLKEIFPTGHSETEIWKAIEEQFFRREL